MQQPYSRELMEAAEGSVHLAKRIAYDASRFSSILASVVPGLAPFDYQADVMEDWSSRLIHWTKPRQVGASHTMGAKAVAKACAMPKSRSIFNSLSLDDAREKIDTAKSILEALATEIRGVPEVVSSSVSKLELSNGSRIIALYNPRGKSKSDLYLDEFAHHPNASKLYSAALPIIITGGRLMMASTVTHPQSFFSKIRRGDGGKYKQFRRIETRWWDCPIHCLDVPDARRHAAGLTVGERVAKYGTDVLRDFYDSMAEEEFLAEFELEELGDEGALLPWELILACTPAGEDHIRPLDADGLLSFLDENSEAMAFLGYDVGRRTDDAELSVLVWDGGDRVLERHAESFVRQPFHVQEEHLHQLLVHPRTYLAIDETGMGMQMAENLRSRYKHRVIPVNFSANIEMPIRHREKTAPATRVLSTVLKASMLDDEVRWQVDKRKNAQMHSIRRVTTEAMNTVLRVDRSGEDGTIRKHHGDVFWARALAVWRWKMRMNRSGLQAAVITTTQGPGAPV